MTKLTKPDIETVPPEKHDVPAPTFKPRAAGGPAANPPPTGSGAPP